MLSLVGEVLRVADEGIGDPNPGLPISMLLTSAVVAWVSYGVLTGRTVRRVLALVLLALSAVGFVVSLVFEAVSGGGVDGWDLLYVVVACAMFAALVSLVGSPYDAWQRTHHDGAVPGVAWVVALAALSGLLGPVPGQGTDPGQGFHVELNLGQEPLSDRDSPARIR